MNILETLKFCLILYYLITMKTVYLIICAHGYREVLVLHAEIQLVSGALEAMLPGKTYDNCLSSKKKKKNCLCNATYRWLPCKIKSDPLTLYRRVDFCLLRF